MERRERRKNGEERGIGDATENSQQLKSMNTAAMPTQSASRKLTASAKLNPWLNPAW